MIGRNQAQLHGISALIALFTIVGLITVAFAMWSSFSKPAVKFSYVDWIDSEITSGENAHLQVRVKNVSEDDHSVAIQITTKSPNIIISRLGKTLLSL